MIFITAKFRVRPEDADEWPSISRAFTEATRAEPGCLWFDWSRSLDDPTEYVLVEAFRDDEAGAAHVGSDHNFSVPQDDWSELGELRVDGS
jgi:quinol monooxygenase YgiN